MVLRRAGELADPTKQDAQRAFDGAEQGGITQPCSPAGRGGLTHLGPRSQCDVLEDPSFLAEFAVPGSEAGCCVLIVEENALEGQRLALRLQMSGFRAVVCSLGDELSILEHAFALEPQVVLLDLVVRNNSTKMCSLVPRLRSLGAAVIAFTGCNDASLAEQAVEAGVGDIVSKAAPIEEILGALRGLTAQGRVRISQRASVMDDLRRHKAEQRARLAPFEALTKREAAVLEHMMRGQPAEVIATYCFVSLATVRSQIRAILTKLGVNSQLAAVAMAYQAGWAADAVKSA